MASGKDKPPRGDGWRGRLAGAWRRFRSAGGVPAGILVLALAAGVVLMDVWPIDPLPYRAGRYVSQDLRARVDFSVRSRKLRGEADTRVRSNTPASFAPDANLVEQLAAELKAVPRRMTPYTQPASMPQDIQKAFAVGTAEGLAAWRAQAEPNRYGPYVAQIDAVIGLLRRVPLVRTKDKDEQAGRGAAEVRLGGDRVPKYELIGLDEANRIEAEAARVCRGLEEPLRRGVEGYLVSVFTVQGQALWAYDANATQKDIAENLLAIELNPPVDRYQAGDILVRAGSAGAVRLLEAGDIELLQEEHKQFLAHERKIHPVRFVLHILGREAILLLIVLLAGAYVWRYRPEAVARPADAAKLAALLLALLGATKLLCQTYQVNEYCAALPVVAGALALCVAYDQRFAIAIGSVLAVLTVFVLRADLLTLLVLTAGVTVSAGLLREVRTRTKVILVSAAGGAAMLLGAWAVDGAGSLPFWPVAVIDGAWGAGAAVLAGFLVQGVLPLIERAFGVATSMTLLEWCDADKPLLRRLRMEAPGTYSHCLQLGAVCEAAAEAVGARGLLARAGACYHDIGKINKPEYFVENQAGAPSRHARLSPAMSLLIITGHVRDGLELARQYRLPKVLHEFIATHHGTTLAQYFFQAETDRRKAEEDRAPEEVDFRYPGPKPRSKEAAILMLADACETSVRSMGEPTPGRIENQVHSIVMRRLMDGQLDDCELTLREVWRIEESFVKGLTAMYHLRIAYPTPPGEEPSAAEKPQTP